MTEQRLQDAKIVVKIDTTAAEQELEKFDRKRESGRKDSENRRERSSRDKKIGGRDAFIAGAAAGRGGAFPGSASLLLLIKTIIIKEIAIQLTAGLAGLTRRVADELPEPIERRLDSFADDLASLSEKIESIDKQISAGAGAVGDAVDLARAQRILNGDVDTDQIAEFLLQRSQVRQIEGAIEAGKETLNRTIRAEVLTGVGLDVGGIVTGKISELFSGVGGQR